MLIAVFTCAGFVSCGDDDDDDLTNNPFIGTWVGGYDEDDGYDSGSDVDPVVTMTFSRDLTMTASCPMEDWYFTGSYKYEYDSEYNIARIGMVGRFVDGNGNNVYEGEDVYDDDADFERCYFNGNSLIISFDGSDFKLYRQ